MRTTTHRALALAATSALVLAGCSSDGDSDNDGSGDTLTIGIKFDQPGLGFKDGEEYTGFDVDVARYVADKLGYAEEDVEFVEAISANRETMLEGDQVDMIFATYSITEERDEVVDFAGPYFVAGQDLLVRADETDITGPDTLEGKNLCSVSGSTSAQRVKDTYDQGTGINLVEQPGYSECLSLLTSGQVDAVTTDDIILAGLAAEEGSGAMKVVGNPFSEERYGVGIPEGSDQCQAINDALTDMFEDGSWQEALDAATTGTGFTPNAELNPPTLVECK
ncbi:glutamate ABC transporter substrate-binding protein [Jonesia denitrificans]|uniref:Extracellular solute-binding protein family 3 n=1 Tax=Jonesia denitrificans (strain ATCC 14870 / DSM 20603 / BCRC 15368 / CIP 55.134 / JCM 11481 / NBRC 15587 / NCTC 10816 / Prevot 55134) TaxID=471856 RepID=C7R5G8_JONDD|nr:glutamate ABC transporter substrate-binding protein [Jonesia denitrificans]ACV09241.1 extracellular solute-binding protein family 3 [Jonesia denitrificans DSM 20603]ASE09489.1 ABC transporter substrate-binding protein [Jonesia denitrificans]QXB44035.1 glutamate ABC transporter substrate-binding protein [Jonesia denitrificans]SQH21476.1 Glutamine-binding periplasmic protein precursor [Jonesia denitrificans]